MIINDVTDTAFWIAHYRAEENLRKDALFRDPFAHILIGDDGKKIATHTQGSRYTAWSVVIRTAIIDRFIYNLLPHKIDTIINLGAGLDTRPYRLNLDKNLNWIEVDFENIINYKNEKLDQLKPNCNLKRIALDLSDDSKRDSFLKENASNSKNILVLTEGVIPYLTNAHAKSLADALYSFPAIKFWITEYYSPEILQFLRTPKRIKQMEKSPFQFYPDDWFEFFHQSNWLELDVNYFGIESQKIGRTPPTPGWLKSKKNSAEENEKIKKYLGYIIFKRN